MMQAIFMASARRCELLPIPHARLKSRRMAFTIVSSDSCAPLRARVQHFIAERFDNAYGARIETFLPNLVAVSDGRDQIVAAAGFARATKQPLFMERYLDVSVESALSGRAGRPVFRESIAEVGNLAALRPGGTRVAIVAVLQLLAELKLDWVVCTATRNVRNAVARCGLPPWSLARASREAMGAAADSWGTYYDHDPRVIGGALSAVKSRLAEFDTARYRLVVLSGSPTGHPGLVASR